MNSSVVSALVSLFACSSFQAFASPCTEGNQSRHQLLNRCTIGETPDLVSGAIIKSIDFCMSKIEKSGGPFGGDLIPWYFSHFEITTASGKQEKFMFNSPDGRHNFRSLIDYSVIDLTDGIFSMESHRTHYPENSRKGYVDLHTVTFDQRTKVLRFDYSKRDGVMFGRWEDKISFEAICAE